MNQKFLLVVSAMVVLMSGIDGRAQTPSPVQASVRPLGLPVYSQVMLSGSDDRAKKFNQDYLPTIKKLINDHLKSGKVFADLGTFELDANLLFMPAAAQQPIRVYFIDEGAGYKNSLGFAFSLAGSKTPGTEYLIFPDASKSAKGSDSWTLGTTQTARTSDQPLNTGDFVELTKGGPGWELELFLISQGATGGKYKLWADASRNVDKIQHVVAFQIPDSTFLIISFEDMINGGDADYEDCLVAVDIGFDYQKKLELPQ